MPFSPLLYKSVAFDRSTKGQLEVLIAQAATTNPDARAQKPDQQIEASGFLETFRNSSKALEESVQPLPDGPPKRAADAPRPRAQLRAAFVKFFLLLQRAAVAVINSAALPESLAHIYPLHRPIM